MAALATAMGVTSYGPYLPQPVQCHRCAQPALRQSSRCHCVVSTSIMLSLPIPASYVSTVQATVSAAGLEPATVSTLILHLGSTVQAVPTWSRAKDAGIQRRPAGRIRTCVKNRFRRSAPHPFEPQQGETVQCAHDLVPRHHTACPKVQVCHIRCRRNATGHVAHDGFRTAHVVGSSEFPRPRPRGRTWYLLLIREAL